MKIDLKSTIELQNEKKIAYHLCCSHDGCLNFALLWELWWMEDWELSFLFPCLLEFLQPFLYCCNFLSLLRFSYPHMDQVSSTGKWSFGTEHICFSMQGTFSPFRVLEPKFLNDQLEFNFMDLMWSLFIWFCSRKVLLLCDSSFLMHLKLKET